MSKVITDKLIDDIIEIVLENMDCHHEVDHDEDGAHTSVEYGFKHELKVRNKIIALLEPPPPEKRGLTVDEIISKYPMSVRILLVQLTEQIKKGKEGK